MRVLARVLLGLGAFLLIAGMLAVSYAPGVVKKTPLDVDMTTDLRGSGRQARPGHGRIQMKPAYAVRLHDGGLEQVG